MTAPDRAVVFAVDASTIDLTEGDRLLADALRRRGVDVRPMVWGAPCSPSDTVVIRSTWDYADRPDEFRKWLDDLDATGARIVNPVALLRWNMHKGYRAELAARGAAVVPTEMLVQGSTRSLADVMTARGWSQGVVKPAIGASARETVRADVADPAAFAVAAAYPPTRRGRGFAGLRPGRSRGSRWGAPPDGAGTHRTRPVLPARPRIRRAIR